MKDLNWITDDTGIHARDDEGNILAEIIIEKGSDGTYNITHTYVSDALRGMGMASQLVDKACAYIEEKGGRMTATCSYAKKWMSEHPERV